MNFYAIILVATALTATVLCAVGLGGEWRGLLRSLAGFGGSMFLLALGCFCAFGFLASAELPPGQARLSWQAGYAILGAVSALGVARLGKRGSH